MAKEEGRTRGRGVQGESDSHYKRHLRLFPQRAKEIAQNEDGAAGGVGGGAGEVPTVAAQCGESWPQISQPGGRVLDRTREGAPEELGKRCSQGERPGEGERQMDRGVREAAGYRQGRNCVSGARCQKYVSIMQI